MVSGINYNNYSVAQLKELKQAGMQGITDEVLKAAEEREAKEAKNAKESDEAQVSYEITDDAGKVNEAQQEVDTAKEYGSNLKTILTNLISKAETKDAEMAKLSEEISKYEVQMSDLAVVTEDLYAETDTQVKQVEADVKAKETELNEKQTKIEEETKKAEDEAEKGDAADQSVMETSQKNVESLTSSAKSIADSMKQLETKVSAKIKAAAATKAALLGESMEDVKNKATASLNDAINANEYADVTIEKGTEAANIKDKNAAKEAGFTKKKGFIFKKKKGDVGAANKMGNEAIAKGEKLGNSSQGVAKEVKVISSQYGLSFAKTSGINDMLKKEYVDTSKMDEVKQLDDGKGIRTLIKNVKSKAANQKIYDEIADAAKNKKTSTTGTTETTTGTTSVDADNNKKEKEPKVKA